MRTSIFIFMILSAVATTSGFAQSIKIPKATKDAFAIDFPEAENPRWRKGEFGFGFSVTFTVVTLKNVAFYDQFGQLYEHTIFLTAELLPEAVRSALSAYHPQAKIGQIMWVRNLEGTFYHIELLQEGKMTEVRLDSEGNLFDGANGNSEAMPLSPD